MIAILAAAALALAPEATPACQDAYDAHWTETMTAKEADRHDDVLRHLEPIETACADADVAPILATLHAETDLLRGQAAEAVARLDQTAVPATHQIWPLSRLIYLSALEVTGDAARFRAVRDELLAAHDAALSAKAKKLERFETAAAVVDAYQTDLVQGPGFRRLLVFVAAPKNGGMPVTLTLTDSPATALLGEKNKTYAVDLYPCDSHATVAWVPAGRGGRAPDYAEIKPHAERAFAGENALRPFRELDEPRFCAYEGYMLPGFE